MRTYSLAYISLFDNLINFFVKPTVFFSKLKRQPQVFLLLISIITLLIVYSFIISDLAVDQMVKRNIEKWGNAPPENVLVCPYIFLSVMIKLLNPIVLSIICWVIMNGFLNKNIAFNQIFSIVLYSFLIQIIGLFVTLTLKLPTGNIYASYSLGMLAPSQNPADLLFFIMSKIEIFYIWKIIVLGFGISVLCNFEKYKGVLLSAFSVILTTSIYRII